MLKPFPYILFMLLLGGVLYSAKATAQSHSPLWKDYSFIQETEAWLTSQNAAGLKALPVNNISMAEVFFRKDNGSFINYYQSDNAFTLGANIASFYRLNPSIVFSGKVNYHSYQGKNMGGSAFINPLETPFDLVEYTDSTRGKKKQETYLLSGAVSADLYKGITLGVQFDFTSANYAKDKDLRHKNKLSDMSINAGLGYRINQLFDLGVNYSYRRRNEGVEFKTYGTTDKQYTTLISYAAFVGKKEVFGETGYTTKDKETPLIDTYHGASVQLKVNINTAIDWFNEFSYHQREGYYGKRSTSSVVYSEHQADIVSYLGKLNIRQGENLHSLDAFFSKESLNNAENVYKTERPQGHSTDIIVYYDPLNVGDKESIEARLAYTAYLGIDNYNPNWTLKAGADYVNKKQTASVYPYFRKQTIRQNNFYLHAARNIVRGKHMHCVSLGSGYTTGSGEMKKDGTYDTPGEGHIAPPENEIYLQRAYDFSTANQLHGEVGYTYAHLFPQQGIKGYVSATYNLTKALKTDFIEGKNRHSVCLTIGCTF